MSRRPDSADSFDRMADDGAASRLASPLRRRQNPATARVVAGVAIVSLAVGVVTTWSIATGEKAKEVTVAPPPRVAAPAPTPAPAPALGVVAAPEKPKPAPPPPVAKAAPLHARRGVVHATPAPAALDPDDPDASPEKVAALGALDRCIAGDGNGCAGVGHWYEVQHDPRTAGRWFAKGCELSSFDACDGVDRVKHSHL